MTFVSTIDNSPVHSEFADDPEYRELLEMFTSAIPERRRSLAEAFRAGNFPELQTLAHQLKGAGGGFGYPGLTERAADLEMACKSRQPEQIATTLDLLLVYMQRVAI